MAFLCKVDEKVYRFFKKEDRDNFFLKKLEENVKLIKQNGFSLKESLEMFISWGIVKKEGNRIFFDEAKANDCCPLWEDKSLEIAEDDVIWTDKTSRMFFFSYRKEVRGFYFIDTFEKLHERDVEGKICVDTLDIENLEREMEKRGSWSQEGHLWTPNSTKFDEEMNSLRGFCLDTRNYIALIQLNM